MKQKNKRIILKINSKKSIEPQRGLFLAGRGTNVGNPVAGKDAILPARVANQNKGFAISCLLLARMRSLRFLGGLLLLGSTFKKKTFL